MNSPLISLIIPMHNAEKFIAECLDSAIQQTYKNIEIIIVDDCSSDKSAEIVNGYIKNSDNIHYFKTENKNAAKTRRDGLGKAKADLICFVDADDVLEAVYVEYLYKVMVETKTSISACEMDIFSGIFAPTEIKAWDSAHTISSDADSFANHYHISDTNKLVLQTLHCKLFKKELFDDIDYTVLVTNIFEDNFVMAQVLRKVDEIGVVDRVLYWYRQTENTTSSGTLQTKVEFEGRVLNFVDFFKDVVMEYCKKTLRGQNVDAAIDRIGVTEFYNYAQMVPELKVHIEHLEQKVKLKEDYAKNRDTQLKAIEDSREYKIGHALTKPLNKIINTFKSKEK